MLNQRNWKVEDYRPIAYVILNPSEVRRTTEGKPVRLTALLDSGPGSMICAKHTSDLKKTSEGEPHVVYTSTVQIRTADSTAGTTVLQRNRMEVPCGTVVRKLRHDYWSTCSLT
jgi:hypothetical protein